MPRGPLIIAFDGTPAAERAIRDAAALLGRRRAVVAVVWKAGLAFELMELPTATIGLPPALGERLSGGEVDDLVRELPDEFAAALQRGDELSNGAARRMSLEEFVRRIAEREGVTPDEAHAQARAVFAMLREALPEREFDDVLAQLPRDYAALTARP
jgi:uncharacterized protein (DUF2267 family)